MQEDLKNIRSCFKRSDLGVAGSGGIKKKNRKYKEDLFGSFAKRLKQAHTKQNEIFQDLPTFRRKNYKDFESRNTLLVVKLKGKF